MEDLDRRGFLKKAAGGVAAISIGTEAMAQSESSERITLSRLEFNALHFGITPNQLQRLVGAGARFDGDDIAMNIDLWGQRLALSSVDKVVRIVHAGARIVFTIANERQVRQFNFER